MSIRRRLLLWLLSSVLVAGLIASAIVFYQARQQATELFDYQLQQLAYTLRDRTYFPGQLAEALQSVEGLDFVIQVWSADGQRLYRSHPHLDVPAASAPGFSDVKSASGTWRVFATWHQGLIIQVAQYKLARELLAFNVAWRMLVPFLLALPLMGWLIWALVGREMKVLASTAQAVARRTPESLEPIETAAVPEEVQPLVDSLNGLMGRLGGALAQQRQFIADAAHELRTPLTALRLQLQLAERARDAEEREKAHAMLREGIARATHVVEQLLTLARADPEATKAGRGAADLAELARNAVHAEEAVANAKGLALSVQAEAPVLVEGDRAALRTLMENLVDNAVRYTPSGSVTVRAYRGNGDAVFEVEDSGPGIPAAERERVFDRFYRGESASEGGSGLGLAIARRVAERHGGRVELLDAPRGRGLLVRVVLPAQPVIPGPNPP
jgi:two-component system, OmpR family, sensor kinase